MEALKELYNNPLTGFLSESKLYAKAISLGIKVTHNSVKEFLKQQEVSQVFHERKVKHYFPLQSQYPFQRIQIDLLDMSNETVRGFKFIFVAIDVYTRYAFCIPMKNKTEGESV